MDLQDRRNLRVVGVTHTLVHLVEGTLPPLIPLLLGVFGTDFFHLGLVMSIFSYAFGLGSLPSGALADRIGPGRLIVLFLFGTGVLCLAVLGVNTLLPFAVVMGFLGVIGSIYHPAANTFISLGIKERGRAFGINGIAGSIGTSLVPFLAAFFGSKWGWRSPYLIFGVAALLVGVLALSLPTYKASLPSEKDPGDAQTPKGKIVTSRLILFYLSCAIAGMGHRGVLTFLPAYLGTEFNSLGMGLDPVRIGGIFATVTLFAGTLGQYTAGTQVDRRRPQKLYVNTLLIVSLSVLLMSVTGGPLLFLGALGFGFFSFAIQPMQNTIVYKLLPNHRRGAGYGFMYFMTFGIGSVAAAFSGWLADRYGLPSVFLAMGVCYAGAMLAMYGAERWEQKKNAVLPI